MELSNHDWAVCFSDTVQLGQIDPEGGNREISPHPQENTFPARWDKHTFGYVMSVLVLVHFNSIEYFLYAKRIHY